MRLVLILTALAACSDRSSKKADPAPSPLARGDAGITVFVNPDPTGTHVDEDTTPRPVAPAPTQAHAGRPIDVTLRSTPPGAQVAVDGSVIGNTPAFWSGMADGREHEFVFTLKGHAIARYRFVPVASGVIHGRLDPITEEPDAGVPPPELVPHAPANAAPALPGPAIRVDATPAPSPAPPLGPTP